MAFARLHQGKMRASVGFSFGRRRRRFSLLPLFSIKFSIKRPSIATGLVLFVIMNMFGIHLWCCFCCSLLFLPFCCLPQQVVPCPPFACYLVRHGVLFLPRRGIGLNHTSYAAFSWRTAALNSSCARIVATGSLSKSLAEGPRTLGLGGSSSRRIRRSRGPHSRGLGAERLEASYGKASMSS